MEGGKAAALKGVREGEAVIAIVWLLRASGGL